MTHPKKLRKLLLVVLFCVLVALVYFIGSYFSKKSEGALLERSIVLNSITEPTSSAVTFLNKDFKLLLTEFTDDTKVWSSFYVPEGQNLDSPDEELIFNFYLDGLWAKSMVSPEKMAEQQAERFGDSLIGEPFAIEQSHTGRPSYFMTAYAYFPEEKAGSLYVAKISSIEGSAYQILYIKKIVGTSEKEVKDKAIKLYEAGFEPGDILYEKLDKIEIGNGWVEYLQKKQK